jgi:xylulose-5-phosphate/fructose-6-phosphate phosphoketolase
VLPILHLNGYKIANPTVIGRMSDDEVRNLFLGYGHEPLFVEGDDPATMHRLMAAMLDTAFDKIRANQTAARDGRATSVRPKWPMIVLRSPKGWTGPKEVDGLKVEGFWRAHQVPIANPRGNPEHLQLLEQWMRSYQPEKLFDENGLLRDDLQALAPAGERRMGANPHANGGLLKRELKLPDFHAYAVDVPRPGGVEAEATRIMGQFLREVVSLNAEARNFRIMGPDETASNRLDAVFEVTERVWMEPIEPYDVHLAESTLYVEIAQRINDRPWERGRGVLKRRFSSGPRHRLPERG